MNSNRTQGGRRRAPACGLRPARSGLSPVEAVTNEALAHGLPQRRRLSQGAAARSDLRRVEQALDRVMPADSYSVADRVEVRERAMAQLALSRARRVQAARSSAVTQRRSRWSR
jgi:hypothetical protein